jgi:hypothetical protein
MLQRIVVLVIALCSASIQAQVPTGQLAKPPANAQTFSLVSSAGTHGKSAVWVEADVAGESSFEGSGLGERRNREAR